MIPSSNAWSFLWSSMFSCGKSQTQISSLIRSSCYPQIVLNIGTTNALTLQTFLPTDGNRISLWKWRQCLRGMWALGRREQETLHLLLRTPVCLARWTVKPLIRFTITLVPTQVQPSFSPSVTLIWHEEEGRRTGADLSTLRMLTVMVVPIWKAPSLTDRKMKSVLSSSAPLWVYWNVLLCTSL